MLRISQESFLKDLFIWFLVSLIVASLFSAAAGALADRYFSRAVSGLIGEAGEYDLLFQVRSDLQEAAVSRLEEIIAKSFPGSVLKTGVKVAGQSTIFVGLAPQYRTKEVFSSLRLYFQDIPGNSGFSLMTEPRLTLSCIPVQVHDVFIREAERIPGWSSPFRRAAGFKCSSGTGGTRKRSKSPGKAPKGLLPDPGGLCRGTGGGGTDKQGFGGLFGWKGRYLLYP